LPAILRQVGNSPPQDCYPVLNHASRRNSHWARHPASRRGDRFPLFQVLHSIYHEGLSYQVSAVGNRGSGPGGLGGHRSFPGAGSSAAPAVPGGRGDGLDSRDDPGRSAPPVRETAANSSPNPVPKIPGTMGLWSPAPSSDRVHLLPGTAPANPHGPPSSVSVSLKTRKLLLHPHSFREPGPSFPPGFLSGLRLESGSTSSFSGCQTFLLLPEIMKNSKKTGKRERSGMLAAAAVTLCEIYLGRFCGSRAGRNAGTPVFNSRSWEPSLGDRTGIRLQ